MYMCLNAAPFTRQVMQLPLQDLDILILNEVEMSQMIELLDLKGESLETSVQSQLGVLHDKLEKVALLVVTQGSKGVSVSFRNDSALEYVEIPAMKIKNVIDSTGAGDTFVGYFLSALFKQDQPEALVLSREAIVSATRVACCAAGMACLKPGAMSSIPVIDDVINQFKEWK